jgi:hypothetical protein
MIVADIAVIERPATDGTIVRVSRRVALLQMSDYVGEGVQVVFKGA